MRVCGECNISIHQGLLYERRKQREGSKRRKRLEKWRWPAQWTRDGQNGGHEWSGGSRSAGRLEQHFEENESLPRETRRFERVFTNHGKVNSIYIFIFRPVWSVRFHTYWWQWSCLWEDCWPITFESVEYCRRRM